MDGHSFYFPEYHHIWCLLILCLPSQGTGLARLWRSLTTRLTTHRFLSRCFSKPHIFWEWRNWGYDVCLHLKLFADLCLIKDSKSHCVKSVGTTHKGSRLQLDKFLPEKLFGIVVQWNYWVKAVGDHAFSTLPWFSGFFPWLDPHVDHAGSTQRNLQTCGAGSVAASREMCGVCMFWCVCMRACSLLFVVSLHAWGAVQLG